MPFLSWCEWGEGRGREAMVLSTVNEYTNRSSSPNTGHVCSVWREGTVVDPALMTFEGAHHVSVVFDVPYFQRVVSTCGDQRQATVWSERQTSHHLLVIYQGKFLSYQ